MPLALFLYHHTRVKSNGLCGWMFVEKAEPVISDHPAVINLSFFIAYRQSGFVESWFCSEDQYMAPILWLYMRSAISHIITSTVTKVARKL